MLPYTTKKAILGFLLILAISVLHGQAPNQSEADVLARAEALYEQNNWQEALPLYAQLVSVNPQKPEYNYKFGVCSLLGDRANHRRPIRYLTNAYKTMSTSAELNYYLGLAYYQNEEFANAMKYLNLFLGKLDADSPQRSDILEKINACLNGMNLEHNNKIAEIIDKTKFQKDNFHRAYRADDFNGMLILKPDNFISSQEKKSGTNSYVYISEPRGTLYFSSYENNQSTQRDIYKVSLDENSDWGTPEKLAENINTKFDEAYPVLTNNGTTLYFSSKGHNSMGGYDIFVSTYDPETNSFSTPENMGMGINSTFDDILFIPEKSEDLVWYSSDRDNLNNDITVYKVRLNNHQMENEAILAQNALAEETEQTLLTENIEQTNTNTSEQKQHVTQQEVAPAIKAANKLNERTLANQLADTAYILVSKTKTSIRNLTNKRDRANMISQKKAELAKNMEVEFEAIVANLPNAENKDAFEQQLTKAIRLKKETYQFRMRADQANKIAWSIGKHIKVKNSELIELKKEAGNVQTLSVQGNFEGVKDAFALMAVEYKSADTLTDYTQNIIWITKDEVMFNLPESEMAFADNLRQGYDNHTMLATNTASKPAVEDIPINIVDKRTQTVALEKAPSVKVLALVEQVAMESYTSTALPGEVYELEINFDIDAIQVLPLIAPVEFIAMNDNLDMDDEPLEINTSIDAIDAYEIINVINFEMLAFESTTLEDEIEINFLADAIDALPIIQPILFEALAEASLPTDEFLEINSKMDGIEPYQLINTIDFEALAFASFSIDEDIEINDSADAIDALPIIQPILFEALAEASLPTDELLEINSKMDGIEPYQLINTIDFEAIAYESFSMDEDIEINASSDVIEALPIIQAISVEFLAHSTIPEDDVLEINTRMDAISAFKLIEPIVFENIASADYIEEEILELNMETEIEALQLVQAISIDMLAINTLPKEEALEFSRDMFNEISVVGLIAPIEFSEIAFIDLADENLEIIIEQELTPAIALIQPINFTDNYLEIAMEESLVINSKNTSTYAYPVVMPIETSFIDIAMNMEETLEISDQIDQLTPLFLIQPIFAQDMAANSIIEDESLEISFEEEKIAPVEVYNLVMPITYQALAKNEAEVNEQLEISFSIDVVEVIPSIYPIEIPVFAANDFSIDDELQISFYIDEHSEREVLTADNAAITLEDMKEISYDIPQVNNEYYYLRQTMGVAENIETSRTDFEMLRLALAYPEDLSYEELLFAASLTPKPQDKLKIYNVAFVHLDRDWRAFNNAAVIALNIKDLDKAECFLYQATLISEDNGKILNNLGILDCYKSDFASAENHFLAASEKGINTEYNLQVVNNIDLPENSSEESLQSEMGKTRYFDIIGDNGGLNVDQ